jgi:hypothetical protein
MLSLATGKIVTRDQFRILPMSVSVIQILNRMAAADGITPQTITGVPTDTIRDHPTAASQLPTYLPSHHNADDPTFTMNAMGAGEIELADEIGMQPPSDDTLEDPHNLPDWTIAHGEVGDVPRNDNSNNLPDPIDTNVHEDTGNEHHDSSSDGIRGDIRGADNMEESIGGAEHYDRGDIRGLGDDDGDHHQIRGEGGAVTTDMPEQGSNPSAGRSDVQRPGARLLDFFRRRGTDLAMVCSELMSEQAINITVREAIRTRGEEAERVILMELAQMVNKNVWTPIDGRLLTAEERGSIIRSSMFLKEISRTRTCMMTCLHLPYPPVRYSPYLQSQRTRVGARQWWTSVEHSLMRI